jgi:hypothetical protein
MFFSQLPTHLAKAEELKQAPPKGTPYSVGLPGTEQEGRSRVYRAWNYQKELLKTLDPEVRLYLGYDRHIHKHRPHMHLTLIRGSGPHCP